MSQRSEEATENDRASGADEAIGADGGFAANGTRTTGPDRADRGHDGTGTTGLDRGHDGTGNAEPDRADGNGDTRRSAGIDRVRDGRGQDSSEASGAGRVDGGHDGIGIAGAQGAGGGDWRNRGDGGSAEADRIWRALEAEGLLGETEPDVIQATTRLGRTPARSVPVRGTPADDEEHFVPPAPPPLPRLDSLAKGAWTALFGGPGYLVIATALHWSVPGYAAFCAVAAFVTGFALLVLRMNESGPGGPDDGDDGAVV